MATTILKRWNDTSKDFEELYPKTLIGNLYANDASTPLFISNKLSLNYLPNSALDNLHFVDSLTGTETELSTLFDSVYPNTIIGSFWLATATTSLKNTTPVQIKGTVYYSLSFSGSFASTSQNSIQSGDWVIITSGSGSGTQANPYLIVFSLVNSTYEASSSSSAGVVKLVSDTRLTNNGTLNDTTGAPVAPTSASSRTYAVQNNSSGQLVVHVPWVDNDTTYQSPNTTTTGVIKAINTGSSTLPNGDTMTTAQTTAGRYYPINILSTDTTGTDGTTVFQTGFAYVNVPWTDADTTYTADETSLTMSSNVLSHKIPTGVASSIDNSNGSVVQDIALDTYGHLLATGTGSVDLDGRYYTETEVDTHHQHIYSNTKQPTTTYYSGNVLVDALGNSTNNIGNNIGDMSWGASGGISYPGGVSNGHATNATDSSAIMDFDAVATNYVWRYIPISSVAGHKYVVYMDFERVPTTASGKAQCSLITFLSQGDGVTPGAGPLGGYGSLANADVANYITNYTNSSFDASLTSNTYFIADFTADNNLQNYLYLYVFNTPTGLVNNDFKVKNIFLVDATALGIASKTNNELKLYFDDYIGVRDATRYIVNNLNNNSVWFT